MKKSLLFGSILLLAVTIGAATGSKITAELMTRKINYCGNISNQVVISYKDSTYVPLRAFNKLVNIETDYKDGVIYLGKNTKQVISYWDKDIKHMSASQYATYEYKDNGPKRKDTLGDTYTNYLILGCNQGEGRINFPLKGKYTSFESTLSIPEGYENQADITFKIDIDGKEVYAKNHRTSDMPEHIKLDVSGAQNISFSINTKGFIGSIGLYDGKFIQ